jgi:hypothetical protein
LRLRCLLIFALIFFGACVSARAEVIIWAEGCIAKVKPDAPRPAETYVWDGDRISLKAARGEWAPFQVVINSDQPRVVSFEMYDFSGPRGKVAAANISVYRELYLPVSWPSVDPATNFTVGSGRGRWPDPLVPVIGHADVVGGENTVFWFDLFVPSDTLPGKYEGEITLKWSGGDYSLPLELAVWDFELSRDRPPPLVAAVNADEVCRLYGVKADADEGRAILSRYYTTIKEHGLELFRAAAGAEAADAALPAEFPGDYPFRDYRLETFADGEAYPKEIADLRREGVGIAYKAGGFAGYVDRPASDHRLVGWALWRFGGDVATLGDVSYFPRKNATPLSDDPRNKWGNGAYALVYPGTELGLNKPLPSIRLKLLREAAEDYAYLSALKDAGLAAYADELAAGVVPTLPPAGGSGFEAAALYEAREAAAVALVKSQWRQEIAENVVRGRAVSDDGVPVARAAVGAGPLAAVTDGNGDYELRYVPRGRTLAATAPGYEGAASSGAGGRGDFVLQQLIRRYILNGGGASDGISDKGFEGAGVLADANVAAGPAFVARLKAKRAGELEFRPALRDWRTFGSLVVELYNGSSGRVNATVRATDGAGGFYEGRFLLSPAWWTQARIELELARARFYLEAKGREGGLKFDERPRVNFADVRDVKVTFEGPAGAEVRAGRIWLEARAEP